MSVRFQIFYAAVTTGVFTYGLYTHVAVLVAIFLLATMALSWTTVGASMVELASTPILFTPEA